MGYLDTLFDMSAPTEMAVKNLLYLPCFTAEGDGCTEALFQVFVAMLFTDIGQASLVGDATVPVGMYRVVGHFYLIQIWRYFDVLSSHSVNVLISRTPRRNG